MSVANSASFSCERLMVLDFGHREGDVDHGQETEDECLQERDEELEREQKPAREGDEEQAPRHAQADRTEPTRPARVQRAVRRGRRNTREGRRRRPAMLPKSRSASDRGRARWLKISITKKSGTRIALNATSTIRFGNSSAPSSGPAKCLRYA